MLLDYLGNVKSKFMIKSIEEMYIWRTSRILVNDVYRMMRDCKDWGFRDQIQRASVSIMNNIAEGFESGSKGRFVFYLKVSKGSCSEVYSMLYLCEDFNLCNSERRKDIQEMIRSISIGCSKLIYSLEKGV